MPLQIHIEKIVTVGKRRTRATIEGAPNIVFSENTPQFRSLRPLPKTDSEKNKTATDRMKNPAAEVHDESHANINGQFPAIFGFRSPVIQKTFQKKTARYLYRSMRLRPQWNKGVTRANNP